MLDRTNVRTLTPDAIGGPVELTVADLSFISLRARAAGAGPPAPPPTATCVPMVKPQFEVGRERLGTGGVVRDPAAARRRGASSVAACGGRAGLAMARCRPSPLPGPSGNVEFFLWLRRASAAGGRRDDRAAIEQAAGERSRREVRREATQPRAQGQNGRHMEVGADRRAHLARQIARKAALRRATS